MIRESDVREHMDVVGSDDRHIGRVDHCDGQRIKLVKNDPAAQGKHHYIDLSDVDRVDGDRLRLKVPAQEAMQNWQPA
jgi:hypothetical protein